MSKPFFTHPADIPEVFALAVWHVLHNQGSADFWDVLDLTHAEGKALGWIERIYAANDQPWSEAEQQWWQAQLGSAPSFNRPKEQAMCDCTIYQLLNSRMTKVQEPSIPDRPNFLIVCDYGDWSGFRTLAACQHQFGELEAQGRPDGFYRVVERL